MKNEKSYLAEVRSESENCKNVSFPDFAECVAHGHNVPVSIANAEEALQTHVDKMIKKGDRIPEPSSISDEQARQKGLILTYITVCVGGEV